MNTVSLQFHDGCVTRPVLSGPVCLAAKGTVSGTRKTKTRLPPPSMLIFPYPIFF